MGSWPKIVEKDLRDQIFPSGIFGPIAVAQYYLLGNHH
jgi:hypothetical protein